MEWIIVIAIFIGMFIWAGFRQVNLKLDNIKREQDLKKTGESL